MARRGRGKQQRGESNQLPSFLQSPEQKFLSPQQISARNAEASLPVNASEFRANVSLRPIDVISEPPGLEGSRKGPQMPPDTESDLSRKNQRDQHSLPQVSPCPVEDNQPVADAPFSSAEITRPLASKNLSSQGQQVISRTEKRGRGRPRSSARVEIYHSKKIEGAIQKKHASNNTATSLPTKKGRGRPRSTKHVQALKPVHVCHSTADLDSSPPLAETGSLEVDILDQGNQVVHTQDLSSPSLSTIPMGLPVPQAKSLQCSQAEVQPYPQVASQQELQSNAGSKLPSSEELSASLEDESSVEVQVLKSPGSFSSRERGGPLNNQHAKSTHPIETPQPKDGLPSSPFKEISRLSWMEASIQGQQVVNREVPSSLRKRGRGRTRNIGLEKKQRTGEVLNIMIPPILRRAVGNDANFFINEAGITCRKYAPLQVRKWSDIHSDVKTSMWLHLRETFNLPDETQKAVTEQLNRMYRDWRHRLNMHYKKFCSDEERLQNCPEMVSEDDWKWLVEYFGSDEFKKISSRNKGNRAKQTVRCATGTKSIARSAYEMRDPNTGELPDAARLWRATHQKSDGTWIDSQSEEIMKQLEEVAQKQQQDGSVSLPLIEQLAHVLGTRSGYVRGLGVGPKYTSGISGQCSSVQERQDSQAQIDEAKRRADELEQEVKELKTQLAQTQEQIQAQVAAEVTHRMAAFFDQMTRHMWNLTIPQTPCLHQPLRVQSDSPNRNSIEKGTVVQGSKEDAVSSFARSGK